jgi:hypothetical protein
VTPSQALMGYRVIKTGTQPDERAVADVTAIRENMKQLLAHNQEEQKKRFDAKRCRATPYAVGDLVLIKVMSSECPNGDEPEATTKMARSVPGGEGPGKRSLRFLKQNFTHILF